MVSAPNLIFENNFGIVSIKLYEVLELEVEQCKCSQKLILEDHVKKHKLVLKTRFNASDEDTKISRSDSRDEF